LPAGPASSRVRSVLGVDVTPAMLELATAEAARDGAANVKFQCGDATRLDLSDASFDGAVTRLSLHHIPLPGRCVAEMARVVRPGGAVVLADHVASEDAAAAAWHAEVERLRDPSHWACLTIPRIRELAVRAGLEPLAEQVSPIRLGFADWIARGSTGEANRELIDVALRDRPSGVDSFRVAGDALTTQYYRSTWLRPDRT